MCRGLEASSFVICNMRAYPLRGLSIANEIMYLLVPVFVGHWREKQKSRLVLGRVMDNVDRWDQIPWSQHRTRDDLFTYSFVVY